MHSERGRFLMGKMRFEIWDTGFGIGDGLKGHLKPFDTPTAPRQLHDMAL